MDYFYTPQKSSRDFLYNKDVRQFCFPCLSSVRHFLLLFFLFTGTINAQTTLQLGDIAFTGYQSVTPEKFSFVLLKDVESGTTISFTDHGWLAEGGFWAYTEGIIKLTIEGSYECGTEIVIIIESQPPFLALDPDGNVVGTVMILDDDFTLSTAGDQIFAFQGTLPVQGDESNFIAAIQMNGVWDVTSTGTHDSAKPSVFTDGVNSLAISPEVNNAVYNCELNFGTHDELRAAIYDDENWETSNELGLQISPDCGFICCFPLSIVCPADNYDLPDGCNVEAPPAATTFNDPDDGDPDPSLPTVGGCGELTLTHEDLHSELDCVHILKRIYTITDEEEDYLSCTQMFTWRVDEERPVFDNTPADLTLECDETIPEPEEVTASDNCVPPDILFINEIHYDNSGDDENEFIEIVGQAGIDLSDYELYAYEQDDGEYDDHKQLTGIIPDEGNGWGAIAFDLDYLGSKFFENGVSGLALVKAGIRVIEFISYEGVVIATDGPAKGCTSKLIGVQEGATPDDESVQRVGNACESCDFTWIEPDEGEPGFAMSSPGFINEGQTFNNDLCPKLPVVVELEVTYTPGDCPQEQTITRTWTATDVCGNDSVYVQTITIVDTTPPMISCPANFSVQCIENVPACNPNNATASDNCGEVTITCHQGPLVGGECGGTITNTYTATDECGNTKSCTQIITVDDTTPPMISCPANFSVQCIENVPACNPNNATASDNCGQVTITCVQGPLVGGECGGTITNTYTATDECGNTKSCTQIITVDDTTPPMISCPANFSVQCIEDVPACNPNNATASDNCGQVTITCVQGPLVGGECGGTITNTYTATDECGNTKSCTQIITVDDTTPPMISCPANFSVQCIEDVPACNPNNATASDNCGQVTITCVQGPLVGGACGGTVTNTYTATDECGNTKSCTQIITVDDTTPPMISCPAGFSVQCIENVPACNPNNATASDNCGQVTITCVQGPLVGGGCGGTVTNTYTATDECGNTASCTQIITVDDTTPPMISCPTGFSVQCIENVPACNPNNATASDNCGQVTITCVQGPLVGDACGGTVTNTYTATDECGNTASCTQIIMVDDTTPPTVDFPDDVTIGCLDDPDDLDITGNVIAMDNCIAMGVWINEFHYDNIGTDVGEFVEVAGKAGTNLTGYQLILYNGANGLLYNTLNLSGIIPNEIGGYGAISFSYPVNGLQNGPPDGIALVKNGVVVKFISYLGVFTATNGPANGMLSVNVGVSENANTPVGFSLQLTGFGTQSGDFVWSGPANDSPGSINEGQSIGITIEYMDESDVTVCDGGTILRTWTVTDVCGNFVSEVQTITVLPPADPIITCPADMTVACIEDVDIDPENATVVVDCELAYKLWVTQPSVEGAHNCPGTTYTYTYKVLDDCDGYADCQQVITIQNAPPVVTVIPGLTVECFEDIVTNPDDATVTTSCGDDYELKILPPIIAGIHECPGTTYTYGYRVRDNCGREVIANRVFTIGNNPPPTIVSPPDQTVTCAFNFNVNPNYAIVTTGCTLGFVTTVSGPVITGAPDCPGTKYTYTYTVTDDCGRTASDNRVFTIQNGPPVITCPPNCLIQNCEDGDYLEIINAWITTVTATSSCGNNLVVNNNYNPNNLGFCIWNGYTPVTFTATDACGRTTSCVAMIVITDTEDPIIIEPALDLKAICNANTQLVLDEWVDNNGGAVIEDGCWGDDITWSTSPANPTINCMGMMGNTSITVTFTATDGCGNSISTTAIFTALMANGNDVIIHGGLITEDGAGVEGAQVMLDGNSAGLPTTLMSDIDGNYQFDNVMLQSNYVVDPQKNDDPLNGLSTFDIVLMTKHILVTELLSSPFKIIAADINKSGTVSTLDIIKLRRLILFIDTEFENNTSWRFGDAEFVFPDPANPFASSFPEVYSINGLTASEEANFVAIKVGDLNGSANPNSFTSGEDRNMTGDLTFELEEKLLSEGKLIEIPFRSSDFNGMLGYQFTLNFNPEVMDFIETEAGSLTKLDASNFGLTMLDKGVITTSWSNNVATDMESDEILFTLRFTAKANAKLSEVLRISSQYTRSEAYNNNGLLNIGLNFNVNGKAQNTKFALYQNQPNPFKNETVIGFNLPESGHAKMKFFDVTGNLLKVIEGEFNQGYNEINVSSADFSLDGLFLYYQLEAVGYTATKKMILINLK